MTVDGATVGVINRTATQFGFTSPSHAPGAVDVTVTGGAGLGATRQNALTYVGYTDDTATRSPGSSAVDDLSAFRAAVGDLDGDNRADDVVLVSYDYYYNNFSVYYGTRYYNYSGANSPGTRATYTRLLFGDANGNLVDQTANFFPAQQGCGEDVTVRSANQEGGRSKTTKSGFSAGGMRKPPARTGDPGPRVASARNAAAAAAAGRDRMLHLLRPFYA